MKLIYGPGSPRIGGCWMVALQQYTKKEGDDSWHDAPPSVDPEIRGACIALNDICKSDEEREALIGPMLFDPLGTMTDDPSVFRRREELALSILNSDKSTSLSWKRDIGTTAVRFLWQHMYTERALPLLALFIKQLCAISDEKRITPAPTCTKAELEEVMNHRREPKRTLLEDPQLITGDVVNFPNGLKFTLSHYPTTTLVK